VHANVTIDGQGQYVNDIDFTTEDHVLTIMLQGSGEFVARLYDGKSADGIRMSRFNPKQARKFPTTERR
jgi:hypothetical protein